MFFFKNFDQSNMEKFENMYCTHRTFGFVTDSLGDFLNLGEYQKSNLGGPGRPKIRLKEVFLDCLRSLGSSNLVKNRI